MMASNYWLCNRCSHSNSYGHKMCVRCGLKDKYRHTAMADLGDDMWTCSSCTFNNEGYSTKCSACGVRNGMSSSNGWGGRKHKSPGRWSSQYGLGIDEEVRIVLLGKTGSGKSATGNTILNGDFFRSSASGSSITQKCTSKSSQRFGRSIQVVDTPGIFDTNAPNDVVQREIVKCIGITSPGPHCFLLVLGLTRFTVEEEESVDHFVNYFGQKVFKYFVVLFTRKDDLDHHGLTLDDHLRTVPPNLKRILQRCDHRCIAFNNRAVGPERHDQVQELLDMIEDIVRNNRGECYTDDMYSEAEKVMRKRQKEIERKRERDRDRERKEIEREIEAKYKRQLSSHHRSQADVEMKVAELESQRDFYREKSVSLNREIQDLEDLITLERQKYGTPSSHLLSKLRLLQDERSSLGSRNERAMQAELDSLKDELHKMQKKSKKMLKEKDKLYQERLEEHDRRFYELEHPRQVARQEVETGSGNVGEALLGGIISLGKLLWKGLTSLF